MRYKLAIALLGITACGPVRESVEPRDVPAQDATAEAALEAAQRVPEAGTDARPDLVTPAPDGPLEAAAKASADVATEAAVRCAGRDPDRDTDGYIDIACGGNDCDDNEAQIHPGAQAHCGDRDWDCDGQPDRSDDFCAIAMGTPDGVLGGWSNQRPRCRVPGSVPTSDYDYRAVPSVQCQASYAYTTPSGPQYHFWCMKPDSPDVVHRAGDCPLP